MTVSWIINFKSIRSGHEAARGRKRTETFPDAAAALGTLSRSCCLYRASRCSRLLIGLLPCIGVRVIGYFTRVRVELVEGKGQATRLSLSCTTLIHQLLSGTRGAAAALSRHSLLNPLARGSTPLPECEGLQLRLRALQNLVAGIVMND